MANTHHLPDQQAEVTEQTLGMTARTDSCGSDEVALSERQGSLSSRRPKTPRSELGISIEGLRTDPAPSPNARSRKMRKSFKGNRPD